MKGGPTMGLVSSWETPESSLSPSSMWGHSEKTLSMNQDEGPHWTPDLPAP